VSVSCRVLAREAKTDAAAVRPLVGGSFCLHPRYRSSAGSKGEPRRMLSIEQSAAALICYRRMMRSIAAMQGRRT
jgi:hypothetical protein